MSDQAQCYAVSLQTPLILVILYLQTLICFNLIQSELVKQNVVPSRDVYLWADADYKSSGTASLRKIGGGKPTPFSLPSTYKILDLEIFDLVRRGAELNQLS